MKNDEKYYLKQDCKAGLSFEEIQLNNCCSDSTIRKYMKVFSPNLKNKESEK